MNSDESMGQLSDTDHFAYTNHVQRYGFSVAVQIASCSFNRRIKAYDIQKIQCHEDLQLVFKAKGKWSS